MRDNHLRTVVLALVGFGLLTVAVFRPTLNSLAHTVPAFRGQVADTLIVIWATSHVSRALFSDPLNLFNAGIFHPAPYTLAHCDHLIGQALLGLPVWLATENPLLEYNLLSLLSYVLGATAMFVYAREHVGTVGAAAAAGITFAFTPFRFHVASWLHWLVTFFMPLSLLFWLRFVRSLRGRDWALWVACWVAHSLMGMYLALFFALTMGVVSLTALIWAPTRRNPRLWIGTLLAPLTALLLLAPTLWPYVYLRLYQGHAREWGFDSPLSYWLPGPGTITGYLAGLQSAAPPGQVGPGLVVVGLALLGVIVGLLRARTEGRWGQFRWNMHVTGLATSLFVTLMPIELLRAVPGLEGARGARAAFFIALLFAGVFVAEAFLWITARLKSGRAATVVAVALLLVLVGDMGTPLNERKRLPLRSDMPAAYRWLASLPSERPEEVIYEGVIGWEAPTLAMYYSIFHGKRLANGYSAMMGPWATYVSLRLHRFPAPDALDLLRTLGIRHVLWHFRQPAEVERFIARLPRSSVDVVARFGTDVIFKIRDESPSPIGAPVLCPLPRIGRQFRASHGQETVAALDDGDRQTAWRAQVTPGGSVPWIMVDLGAEQPVSGVRIVTPHPLSLALYVAHVEVSTDGANWRRIEAIFRPDSLVTLIERAASLRYYEARFPTQAVRYLRLINPILKSWGGRWSIAELDVLSDCTGEATTGRI